MHWFKPETAQARQSRAYSAFHGKPPRLYFRMLAGDERAWGGAARTPRQHILDALARVGLTLRRVQSTHTEGYRYGELVESLP